MTTKIWREDRKKASVGGYIEAASLLVFFEFGLFYYIIPGTGAILLSSLQFFAISKQIFQAKANFLVGKSN